MGLRWGYGESEFKVITAVFRVALLRHRRLSHVGLVDPEAERGAYTIEMRGLWGFDAQVASGKLRECAGFAPQGDTEVDTLHRPVAGSPRVWTH